MTDEEQRIAIAKICGLDTKKYGFGGAYAYKDENGHMVASLPDYNLDLNAMHKAIFIQPRHIKILFSKNLREVVSRYHSTWPTLSQYEHNYFTENATANQRAEALLKTIG